MGRKVKGQVPNRHLTPAISKYRPMYARLNRSLRLTRPLSLSRALSTRASTVLNSVGLHPKHGVLNGVYDGKWRGTGSIVKSVCPTTGEHLADVTTVRSLYYSFAFTCSLFLPTRYTCLGRAQVTLSVIFAVDRIR